MSSVGNRLATAVLLAASLGGCFDSKRIVFDDPLADAGSASGARAAPPSQATAAAPAPVAPADTDQRAAAPGSLEATAVGDDLVAARDAGVVPSAVDAGAADAAP